MKTTYTLIALGAVLAIILLSFWRAQRDQTSSFDLFDLLLENGRVSRIAVAFLLVLLVTTWIIIDLQLKGQLTEGLFAIYTGAWVAPLVAKVVFNRQDPPTSSTFTSTTEKTTVISPDPKP